MRIFSVILSLWALSQSTAFSQTLRAWERAGDEAFENKDFGAAVHYYGAFLKRDEDNMQVWWKYADCAREYSAFDEAERAYNRVAGSKKSRAKFPLLEYRLGEIKKMQGDYDDALAHFERFLADTSSPMPEFRESALREIEALKVSEALSASSTAVEVKHLGKEVNSPFSEFSPIIVGDTMYFSSYRFDQKGSKKSPKDKITKIMMSVRGGRAKEPGKGFPATDTAHIAHTAFSPDGHYVVFTVCKGQSASDIRCELWLTVLDRRNRWLPAVRLPEPINLPGYTNTQPSIGFDDYHQGPVLWFASDRPGGKGKLDLWYSPLDTVFFCECALPLPGKSIGRLPKFSPPVNAAELNSERNEGMPFFHAPSQKIYFSSDGWPGLGGYDIFNASKDSTLLSEPKNAGPGLNTSYNDLYFFLRKDGQNGYLSSNRPGSYYLDEANKACCNDIFSFKLPKPVQREAQVLPPMRPDTPNNLALKTPEPPQQPEPAPDPVPETPAPPPVKVPEIRDFVGLPLYFDNDEPDPRTRRSSTAKTYEETVQAYLARQDEYRQRLASGSKTDAQDQLEAQSDDFFEAEVRQGYDRLAQLAELLLERLQKGEHLEILIKGFTSPRAQSDYNVNLGKRRISSVRNYFEQFAEGVLRPYVQAGQLKILEASFGETTAKASVSDDLRNERLSIYHPDAARERRVEIVEIRNQR
jgi:outer membrane protein OmpA-like peptidoglycan-associated protein